MILKAPLNVQIHFLMLKLGGHIANEVQFRNVNLEFLKLIIH